MSERGKDGSPLSVPPSHEEDLERQVRRLQHTLRDSELMFAAFVVTVGGSVLITPSVLAEVERGALHRIDQPDGAILFEVKPLTATEAAGRAGG